MPSPDIAAPDAFDSYFITEDEDAPEIGAIDDTDTRRDDHPSPRADVGRGQDTAAAIRVVVGVIAVLLFIMLWMVISGGVTPLGQQGYTLRQFSQITNGMSVSDVEAIMGRPGELTVDSSIAGYTGQIYTWKNANGSNMLVQFQNGSVVTKAQYGLP